MNIKIKKSLYGFFVEDEKRKLCEAIDRVIVWLSANKDVEVEFGGDLINEFHPDDKLITINSKTNLRCQLHTLLHEAGHADLYSNKRAYKNKFPSGYNEKNHGINFKVDIIREEVLCWERGLEIAEKLQIEIDMKFYNRHRTGALWSYLKSMPQNGKKGWR